MTIVNSASSSSSSSSTSSFSSVSTTSQKNYAKGLTQNQHDKVKIIFDSLFAQAKVLKDSCEANIKVLSANLEAIKKIEDQKKVLSKLTKQQTNEQPTSSSSSESALDIATIEQQLNNARDRSVSYDFDYRLTKAALAIVKNSLAENNDKLFTEIDNLNLLYKKSDGETELLDPDNVKKLCYRLRSHLEQLDWQQISKRVRYKKISKSIFEYELTLEKSALLLQTIAERKCIEETLKSLSSAYDSLTDLEDASTDDENEISESALPELTSQVSTAAAQALRRQRDELTETANKLARKLGLKYDSLNSDISKLEKEQNKLIKAKLKLDKEILELEKEKIAFVDFISILQNLPKRNNQTNNSLSSDVCKVSPQHSITEHTTIPNGLSEHGLAASSHAPNGHTERKHKIDHQSNETEQPTKRLKSKNFNLTVVV